MQDSTSVAAPGQFNREIILSGEPGLYNPSFDYPKPTPVGKTGPFITHKAITGDQEPLSQPAHTEDWFFWILFAGVLFLAGLKHLHEKRFGLILRSVFSRGATVQITREGSVYQHQSFLLLLVLALISFFLFLYQVIGYTNEGSITSRGSIIMALQFLMALTGFILIKITFVWISGLVFNNKSIAADYAQNIIIFNLIAGIILLPFLFLIAYWDREIFIFIAAGILIILLLIRFVRGFLIGASDTKFSLFHLFLYLCTLEILPLVFIAKFLKSSFFS